MEDAEAASRTMANVVTGPVLVFGAIRYRTAGEFSFFSTDEIKILREGIRTGRITAIHHMAKGAIRPSQVMAIEDADENVVWQPGYIEGTDNASGPFCQSLKRGLACDRPVVRPKSKFGGKGKRAATTNGACPTRKPTTKEPTKHVPKKPVKHTAKKPVKHTAKKHTKHTFKRPAKHPSKKHAKINTKRPIKNQPKKHAVHNAKISNRHGRGRVRNV